MVLVYFVLGDNCDWCLTETQILAIGFLLVILSSALWHNFLPLLVVATYVIAPLPNWICSRCGNPDDFIESSSNAAADFGRFLTGFLVLMGIGMFIRLLEESLIMGSSSPISGSN